MKRPNILLVITDSQGWNVLGESGSGIIRTPNIDRLAATGLSFTRAYNACPLCTPARAGLFTGLYPHNVGAWSNDLPLGSNVATMGTYLREAGYDTAYVGKWHLDGTDYFGSGICPEGWNPQYWYDGRNYLEELSKDERTLWRSGFKTAAAIHEAGIDRTWTWAGRITERAIRFMKSRRIDGEKAPWLLVASYDEPHGPSVCPPPYCDMYQDFAYPLPPNSADDLAGKPRHHREWADTFDIPADGLRQPLYFGASSFVDDEIGRLMNVAFETENTTVVFTTDHGHYLGAHGLDGKGPALYEEVVRVPLIMAGPGVARGAVSDSIVSHLDVLPTLLELAGAEPPPILEGESVVPILADRTAAVRDFALVEFHRFSITHDSWFGFIPIRAIVTKDRKLTINLHQTDELYNLDTDPGELTNLIDDSDPDRSGELGRGGGPMSTASSDLADGPETTGVAGERKEFRAPGEATELHRTLLAALNESRDPFRGPVWAYRPWSAVSRPSGIGGLRRPRPDDGRSPAVYNYDTGLPAKP